MHTSAYYVYYTTAAPAGNTVTFLSLSLRFDKVVMTDCCFCVKKASRILRIRDAFSVGRIFLSPCRAMTAGFPLFQDSASRPRVMAFTASVRSTTSERET